MGKNLDLIDKYKKIYSRILNINSDREIYPEMSDSEFQEFVSGKDWLGVPSFTITKKELTNSDQGHIGLWMRNGIFTIDLWFNGIKAVHRFMNILHPSSRIERGEFIRLIRRLDERYKIIVYSTEKFFSASADWKPEMEVRCKDLTEEKILDLLSMIKKVMEKRDQRQKEIPKSIKATVAISLAQIEIDDISEEKLKEISERIAEITRITHNIQTSSKIKKTEKEDKETNIILKRKMRLYEEGLDEESSEEDYEMWRETLGELRK